MGVSEGYEVVFPGWYVKWCRYREEGWCDVSSTALLPAWLHAYSTCSSVPSYLPTHPQRLAPQAFMRLETPPNDIYQIYPPTRIYPPTPPALRGHREPCLQ